MLPLLYARARNVGFTPFSLCSLSVVRARAYNKVNTELQRKAKSPSQRSTECHTRAASVSLVGK